MLNQATLDKLYALRLTGMAAAYQKQKENPETGSLSFDERCFSRCAPTILGTHGFSRLWSKTPHPQILQSFT
jgi:hypothetical protein